MALFSDLRKKETNMYFQVWFSYFWDMWGKKASKGNALLFGSSLAEKCNYFKAEGSFELFIIYPGNHKQGVLIKCPFLAWAGIRQM